MKLKKIILIIAICIFCCLLLLIFAIWGITSVLKQQSEQLKEQQLQNYVTVADYIFEQIDNGNLDYNQKYSESLFIEMCDDDSIKSIVKNNINIHMVAVYDENVVFFFCLESGSLWSNKGYAIIRNDAIPSDNLDDYSGTFESFINFEKIDERIYIFEVGI